MSLGPADDGGAHRLEGVGAVGDDERQAGEGLDVVNDRRLGKRAGDGGERRLNSRPAAFAFEGFEQSGFFAADVSAGAAVDVAVMHDFGAGVGLAEDAFVVGFLDGVFEDAGLLVVFAADEDVASGNAIGDAGNGDAFEQHVRVVVAEVAVFEGGGFGFVEVDGEVAGLDVLGEEGPLGAAGKAGAAAAAEAGVDDGLDDVGGEHGEGLGVGRVAAGGGVVVIAEEFPLGGVVGDSLEQDGAGKCHCYLEVNMTPPGSRFFISIFPGALPPADICQPFGLKKSACVSVPVRSAVLGKRFELVDEFIRLDRADEIFVDQGRGSVLAEAEAFDFEVGKEAVVGGFAGVDAEGLLHFLFDVLAATEFAGDGAADVDDVFAGGSKAEFFVEGHGVLNFAGGDLQQRGGFVDAAGGDEAVGVHDLMEQREQGGTLVRIPREIRADDLALDRLGDPRFGAIGRGGRL